MSDDNHRKRKLIIVSLSLVLLLGASMSAGFALYFTKKDSNSVIETAQVDLDFKIDQDSIQTYSLLRTTAQDTNAFYFEGDSEDTKLNKDVTGYYKYNLKEAGSFTNGGKVSYEESTNTLSIKQMSLGDKVNFNLIVTNKSTINIAYKLEILDANEDTYSKAIYEALKFNVNDNYLNYQGWDVTSEEKEVAIPIEIEMPLKLKNLLKFGQTNIKFEIEAIQKNLVM